MNLMTNVVLSSIPFYANPNILGIQIPSNGLVTIPNLAIIQLIMAHMDPTYSTIDNPQVVDSEYASRRVDNW